MDAMKLAMQLFRDDDTGTWGYEVPALSIVGTGCGSREEAQRLGYQAIEVHLQGEETRLDGDVILLDVDISPAVDTG